MESLIGDGNISSHVHYGLNFCGVCEALVSCVRPALMAVEICQPLIRVVTTALSVSLESPFKNFVWRYRSCICAS